MKLLSFEVTERKKGSVATMVVSGDAGVEQVHFASSWSLACLGRGYEVVGDPLFCEQMALDPNHPSTYIMSGYVKKITQ